MIEPQCIAVDEVIRIRRAMLAMIQPVLNWLEPKADDADFR